MCVMARVFSAFALLAAAISYGQGAPTGPPVGIGGTLDTDGRRTDHPSYALILSLEEAEQRGLQLYRTGDHAKAYELLADAARHGMKRAQHAVARMHLEGHGVDKNLLVGTALFGLAAESGDRDLKRQYKKLFGVIPDKYQPLVEQQVTYYTQRYGMKVQGVKCKRERRRQSNLVETRCVKQPGAYEDHAWAP